MIVSAKTFSRCLAPLSLLTIALGASSAIAQNTRPYPAEAVKIFVDTCVAQGDGKTISNQTMREICTCNIRDIQKTYTFEEFTRIGNSLGEGKPAPEGLDKLVEGCVNEVFSK